MSIRSLLFGEPYNKELLNLKSFSAEYKVEVKTEMLSVQDEDPSGYTMECRYLFDQSIKSDEIINTIELKDVLIKTANKSLENSVEDLTAIAKISPFYKVARRFNGELFDIRNKEVLLSDWEKAKTDLVPNLFITDSERIGFTVSYEKGLLNTHEALRNNWNYLLMLPEVYSFKHFADSGKGSQTSGHSCKSGLSSNVTIEYVMLGSAISRNKDVVNLKMNSRITNSSHLSTLSINGVKLNPQSYSFRIEASYEISVVNGKVLNAHVNILEKLDEISSCKTEVLLSLFDGVFEEAPKMKLSENKWNVFDK
ncbi:hypothetical protein AY601_1792 [Pedobacter cryoconitis]|uniref:Uncharacterized protein n=1 Tax=Pedobacter cryoconitis TaxID=188932 RepID=A0A127VBI5_9SPHI|nr:hypothetical protein [Pedobacter cryoconitis]AMP98703.1 hypothetical protein AY601_1792 [Pedobacter cryoconitis]